MNDDESAAILPFSFALIIVVASLPSSFAPVIVAVSLPSLFNPQFLSSNELLIQ